MTNKNLSTTLPQSEIFFYETESGRISVEVKLQQDTLWLTQKQMALLFEVDNRTINEHLKNIYQTQELQEDRIIRNSRIVQIEGQRNVTRDILYYNLDAIIAVGYRVNSKKGTKFRQWASSILNEYLVKGYTLNERKITTTKLQELQTTIDFLSTNLLAQASNQERIRNIIDLIRDYTKTWSTLLEYDENRVSYDEKNKQSDLLDLDYEEALSAIHKFKEDLLQKGEASDLFGKIRDDGFKINSNNWIPDGFYPCVCRDWE
jgi:hypothetical protein